MRDILHCDLNNFYASVECRDNPSLRGKPIAVCGSVEARAGIVLAKSTEAKICGVKTGDKIYEARQKCPDIIIVSPRMGVYLEASRKVRAIYQRYTDMVEPFGMDECWLDVTGSHYLFGSSEEIAETIRETVKQETGLTISVGVSFTKVLAKLGSDMKKPDAITVLSFRNYREKIRSLPVSDIIGVGPATEKRLKKLRIHTLGELADTDQEVLTRHLGKAGIWLWRAVNGFDDAIVHEQDYRREVKSVGSSRTLPRDLYNRGEVWTVMLTLADEVTRQLRKHGLSAGGVCVSVKTNDLCYREFQTRLAFPMRTPLSFADAGFKLFCERFDWALPVRAVGIRAIYLSPSCEERQCSIFCDNDKLDREEILSEVSDSLRERFGSGAVLPARMRQELAASGGEKINVFQSIHGYSMN